MKRCLFLAGCWLAGLAWAEPLVMLSSTNADPKHYAEKGACTGYAVELGLRVLREAGFEPEARCYPWRRAVHEGESAIGIMAPVFSKSPEREAKFLYSVLVLEEKVVLVQAAGRTFPYRTPDDLAGKRVGMNRGATFTPQFDAARAQMEVREDDGPEQRLKKLQAGRIDAAIITGGPAAVRYNAKKYGIPLRELVIVSEPIVIDQNFFALARHYPNAEHIMWRINQALRRMKANGSLERYLEAARARY